MNQLELLRTCYQSPEFRSAGHLLIDQLADYLEEMIQGKGPVLPWQEPVKMLSVWPDPTERSAVESVSVLVAEILRQSNHLHHPGYVGHQVSPAIPMAALFEMVSALLNNSLAVYEMSPASTMLERRIVDWMKVRLGFGTQADGVLTSGGSAGNLTGLLAARQVKAGFDVWNQGLHAGPRLGILVSVQAHFSAQRAAQIMGLGSDGCVPVPVDDRFRMDPNALSRALTEARQRGLRVIAVVASAGSTATGAFDPLDPIADFCQTQGLWLHVDGAHGASVCLSAKYRSLIKGIERADSVVWDAHKMLALPSLVTGVLFRRGDDSYAAFSQQASYLFSSPAREEWYNQGHRTLECTKNSMALKLYAVLRLCGEQLFDAYLTRCFDLAQEFASQIEEADDFELAVRPEGNIVCFRYRNTNCAAEKLDMLQRRIRQKIIEQGTFYLVQTELHSRCFLRTTLMNPFTSLDDLSRLLETIRRSGAAELMKL